MIFRALSANLESWARTVCGSDRPGPSRAAAVAALIQVKEAPSIGGSLAEASHGIGAAHGAGAAGARRC
jgi:hypothetical protein